MEPGYSTMTVVVQVVVRIIPGDQALLHSESSPSATTANATIGSAAHIYIVLFVIVFLVKLFSDDDTDLLEQLVRPVFQLFDGQAVFSQSSPVLSITDSAIVPTVDDRSLFWTEEPSLRVKSSVTDGVNGVYFVEDEKLHEIVGIFKPQDEEAFAPGNPKERIGRLNEDSPLKSGAKVGDAFRKEVAAFFLDHDHKAGVPETKFTSLPVITGDSSKVGSLQNFVKNVGSAEDFSPSKFSVDDVHYIGLLDSRIMNLDRHLGNLLVTEGSKLSLIPIDHGFSLPDFRNLADVTFEWSGWKQAAVPFSDEVKSYVESLDILKDARMLKEKIDLRDESIWTYLLASTFVKVSVAAGWTLKDIAKYMQRDLIAMEEPSMFERLVGNFSHENPSFESSLQIVPDDFEIRIPKIMGRFQELCVRAVSM